MAESFDPYHRWLGIPPDQQPANHYRLLGLAAFEDDPEVIRDAAERQIAHVRRYELGRHAALTQKILNELAAAKACLLDAESKARYDEQLRRRQAAGEGRPSEADREPGEAGAMGALSGDRSASRALMLLSIIGAAGVGLLLGAVVMLWGLAGRRPPQAATPSGTSAPARLPAKTSAAPPEPTSTRVPAESRPQAPRPPKIRPIPDRVAFEGRTLAYRVEMEDPGSAPERLSFELARGAPSGATINRQTGQFLWTPGPEHAGREHPITVVAFGAGNLTDRATFRVAVRRVNQRPHIAPVERQQVEAGKSLTFRLVATDPDGDGTPLAYRLTHAPKWVTIDAKTGRCVAEPPVNEAGRVATVTASVAEGGPDGLQAETSFTIAVLPPAAPQTPTEPVGPPARPNDLVFPSGVLKWQDFDIQETVVSDAAKLLQGWADRSVNVLAILVPALGEPESVAALCSYSNADLNGPTVVFHEQRDPMSCSRTWSPRHAGRPADPDEEDTRPEPLVAKSATTSLRRREPPQAASGAKPSIGFWEDVLPKRYVVYRQGKWHGGLATWDEQGRRIYWSRYDKGRRDQFACLFVDDRLRLVVECSRGKITGVHVISANAIERSFPGEAAALADETAGPLMKRIDLVERQLQDEEKAFLKAVERAKNLRTAAARQRKLQDFLDRVKKNADYTEAVMRGLWRAGAGGAFRP